MARQRVVSWADLIVPESEMAQLRSAMTAVEKRALKRAAKLLVKRRDGRGHTQASQRAFLDAALSDVFEPMMKRLGVRVEMTMCLP